MSKRRASVVEVRRSRDGEWSGPVTPAWIATDSERRRFGGSTEDEARQACERFNRGESQLYPNERRS